MIYCILKKALTWCQSRHTPPTALDHPHNQSHQTPSYAVANAVIRCPRCQCRHTPSYAVICGHTPPTPSNAVIQRRHTPSQTPSQTPSYAVIRRRRHCEGLCERVCQAATVLGWVPTHRKIGIFTFSQNFLPTAPL